MGAINDYGQTLERDQREQLAQAIAALDEEGVSLVYLATWRDPFGDLTLYAREVFRAWDLGPTSVLVVFCRLAGEWTVASWQGPGSHPILPPDRFRDLLARAQAAARRFRPGQAVLALAGDLVRLARGEAPPAGSPGGPVWAYLVAGLLGAAGIFLFARGRLCPRCLRPLRRRDLPWGIMWVCPRCGHTRAQRRGRGAGSRGGRLGP